MFRPEPNRARMDANESRQLLCRDQQQQEQQQHQHTQAVEPPDRPESLMDHFPPLPHGQVWGFPAPTYQPPASTADGPSSHAILDSMPLSFSPAPSSSSSLAANSMRGLEAGRGSWESRAPSGGYSRSRGRRGAKGGRGGGSWLTHHQHHLQQLQPATQRQRQPKQWMSRSGSSCSSSVSSLSSLSTSCSSNCVNSVCPGTLHQSRAPLPPYFPVHVLPGQL